jgi:hypothetical protein
LNILPSDGTQETCGVRQDQVKSGMLTFLDFSRQLDGHSASIKQSEDFSALVLKGRGAERS